MSTTNTDESIARALQATKLLVDAEKKFFERKFEQASTIRKKSYRRRLRKKIIATQITMLNILEEEKRDSADARECEKCGLFIDSLPFCVPPENASTPARATGNKRHLSSLPEQPITARLKYTDDEMVTCMECGKTWDGFAQHRCLIDE